MTKIRILCEGHSEMKFVEKVLWKNLGFDRYVFIPEILLTSFNRQKGQMHKGGLTSFSKIGPQIERALKSSELVTTMFDFYAIPSDFPGFDGIESFSDPYQEIEHLEKSLHAHFNKPRNFIPYIQMHEFETLLFADLSKLEKVYFECEHSIFSPLYDCVQKFGNVDLIDRGPTTSPSKRIKQCIPGYDKTVLGIEAVSQIEFSLLREKSRHFDAWIRKLEA